MEDLGPQHVGAKTTEPNTGALTSVDQYANCRAANLRRAIELGQLASGETVDMSHVQVGIENRLALVPCPYVYDLNNSIDSMPVPSSSYNKECLVGGFPSVTRSPPVLTAYGASRSRDSRHAGQLQNWLGPHNA